MLGQLMSHNFVAAHLFRASELRDASVLVRCILTGLSEFVADFVKILTDVGKVGENDGL